MAVIYSSTEKLGCFEVHIYQYQPTDRQIEDRFSISLSNDSKRLIVGVYDGHGGAETAAHVSTVLPATLMKDSPVHHARLFELIDDTMIRTFKKDHSLFKTKSENWSYNAKVVKSGCTALILDINATTGIVHYANAGDCRAVCSNTHQAEGELFQTMDLSAATPSEQDRISSEHLGEELFISTMRSTGRLFGRIMTTRGFGDACYKLGTRQHKKLIDILSSVEDPKKVPMNTQYNSMFHLYKNPPYLTATPDVGIIAMAQDGFFIVATDGLWSDMASGEAANVVTRGIEEGVDNLSQGLFSARMEKKAVGDDVTIIVLRMLQER